MRPFKNPLAPALLAASLAIAPVTTAAAAPAVLAPTWGTNGLVDCVASDGTTIYIGGHFSEVAPYTGPAAAVDASTAAAQYPYPHVTGNVHAVAPDGSGGWYLGGSFTSVQGQPRNNVAQLDAAGHLTAWNPNVTGYVGAIAVSGGTVYVSGTFTSVGGQPRNNIAAVDASTGVVTAWDPNPNASVGALAVSGNTVYAGGAFTMIGGQPRNNIAALDATTGLATPWDANASGYVYTLAVNGATVYAGGAFTTIGGQPRNQIAALDGVSGAATAWYPNWGSSSVPFSAFVYSLAASGGAVYAGGGFSVPSDPSTHFPLLYAFDAASGAGTSWSGNVGGSGYVYSVAANGGTVYVGGSFYNTRYDLSAFDPSTGIATAWNPSADGDVYAVAVSGSTVYAGGTFSTVGAQPRSNIAAIDVATGAATVWNPGANNDVSALAVSGGIVYAGGRFTSLGGQPRTSIAALDAASGAATSWSPNANGPVNALAVSGATVYAGGAFTSIGGQLRNRLAALDAATGDATSWDPNVQYCCVRGVDIASVDALAVSGSNLPEPGWPSTVYVGGQFQTVGGQPRTGIAAVSAVTGAPYSWNPNAYGEVLALALGEGIVYAGGIFGSIGGQPRTNIAALDALSGAATGWDAHPNNIVRALTVSGDLLVGGDFSSIGGQPRSGIAELDQVAGAATPWDPNANGGVYALATTGTTIYAGGDFTTIGGQPQPHFAGIIVDVAVPTLLAQFDVGTSDDGVELRWSFGDPSRVRSVAVERAIAIAGPWLAITPELHEESGVTVALDPTSGEGGPYFYRLVVLLTDGSRQVFGPVSASPRGIPSRTDLALVSPNPTSGGTEVQYAVARTGRVRIEVLDVSGRVERTLADRIHPPGRYAVTWDGAGPRGRSAPGLYFVRLVAPDRRTTRTLAIIR